jgi:hypothetical protein
MTKISKSPQRGSFSKQMYLEKVEEDPNDEGAKSMIEYYNEWDVKVEERESDPEWQKNNMEYDMRTCEWLLEKVRNSDAYAQNLYAAMCNNSFQRLEVFPILKDESWSCSWRYAGGIIADMRQEGDYIDWYCSGIRGTGNDDDPYGEDPQFEARSFVSECFVTDEIREDLERLGWTLHKDSDFLKN